MHSDFLEKFRKKYYCSAICATGKSFARDQSEISLPRNERLEMLMRVWRCARRRSSASLRSISLAMCVPVSSKRDSCVLYYVKPTRATRMFRKFSQWLHCARTYSAHHFELKFGFKRSRIQKDDGLILCCVYIIW